MKNPDLLTFNAKGKQNRVFHINKKGEKRKTTSYTAQYFYAKYQMAINILAGLLTLQWRDRARFSLDFPILRS